MTNDGFNVNEMVWLKKGHKPQMRIVSIGQGEATLTYFQKSKNGKGGKDITETHAFEELSRHQSEGLSMTNPGDFRRF